MAPLVTPATNVSMSSRESARPSRLRAMMSTKGIGPKYTRPGIRGSGFGIRDSGSDRKPKRESRAPDPEPRIPEVRIDPDAAATHRADGHRAEHAPGRLRSNVQGGSTCGVVIPRHPSRHREFVVAA